DQRDHGELHASKSGIADRFLPGWFHGASRATGPGYPGRSFQPHGPGSLGDCGSEHDHRHSPHALHLDAYTGSAGKPEFRASCVNPAAKSFLFKNRILWSDAGRTGRVPAILSSRVHVSDGVPAALTLSPSTRPQQNFKIAGRTATS